MMRIMVAPILLISLALTQQLDLIGRWIHTGPIGEVFLELRADKSYELAFPGSEATTGNWELKDDHIILTPSDESRPLRIDIRTIAPNEVNIDFRNGMAMDFIRSGAKPIKKPLVEPVDEKPDSKQESEKSVDPGRFYGEWYWESGDDDMTLELYPDGTYYFDYWIGDDDYDSEGKYKLEGDSIILTPEEEEQVLTITLLEIQIKGKSADLGDRILIRLAYGKEYWLELDDTIDPDDYE